MLTNERLAKVVSAAFAGSTRTWCDDAQPVKLMSGNNVAVVTNDKELQKITGSFIAPFANPEFWNKHGYILHDPYDEKWIEKPLTATGLREVFDSYQPVRPPAFPGEYDASWFDRLRARVEEDEFDAGDADILVQLTLFGSVVYG